MFSIISFLPLWRAPARSFLSVRYHRPRQNRITSFRFLIFYVFPPLCVLSNPCNVDYFSACAPPRPHAKSSAAPMMHLRRHKGPAVTNRIFSCRVSIYKCPRATRGSTQLDTRGGCFQSEGWGGWKRIPAWKLNSNRSVLSLFCALPVRSLLSWRNRRSVRSLHVYQVCSVVYIW